MGERIGGEDGSDGGRVGGRCVGGINSNAYGDSVDGVGRVQLRSVEGWRRLEVSGKCRSHLYIHSEN